MEEATEESAMEQCPMSNGEHVSMYEREVQANW